MVSQRCHSVRGLRKYTQCHGSKGSPKRHGERERERERERHDFTRLEEKRVSTNQGCHVRAESLLGFDNMMIAKIM
jgi:hypothetical protein